MATWLCPGTKCTNMVTGDQICDDCYLFLADVIEEVGPLWTRARTLLPKGTLVASERVRVSVVGSAAPLNLTVYEAVHDTFTEVITWERTIRFLQEDPPDRRVRAVSELGQFMQARLYLMRMRHCMMGSGLLTQFYNCMYYLHRRLVEIAGDSPETQRIPRPCPTCAAMTLISRHVGDYVTCLTCSGRWGQSAYLGLVRRADVTRASA